MWNNSTLADAYTLFAWHDNTEWTDADTRVSVYVPCSSTAAMWLVTATEERESWPSVAPYTAKRPLPNIVPFPATAALGFSLQLHLLFIYIRLIRNPLCCLASLSSTFIRRVLFVVVWYIGGTTNQTFLSALLLVPSESTVLKHAIEKQTLGVVVDVRLLMIKCCVYMIYFQD